MKWVKGQGRYNHSNFATGNLKKFGDDFKPHIIGDYIIGEFFNYYGIKYHALIRKKYAGFWSDEDGDSIHFHSLQDAMAAVMSFMAKDSLR